MTDLPQPSSRPFRRWAGRLSLLYLLLILLATATLWGEADTKLWVTLLHFGPRWLAIAPLSILLLWSLLSRSRWGLFWCLLAAGVVAWPFMGAVLNVPQDLQSPKGEYTIRVMSFNADNKDCDRKQFQAFLAELQPDIVALQDADRIREPDFPPGYFLVPAANGLKLAARFPVALLGDFSDPRIGPARGAARFQIRLPDRELEICVVHLPTPRPGLEAVLARKPNALADLDAVNEQRNAASQLVRKWLGDTTLVVGDFNLPVESVMFRRDWRDFSNAFAECGFGYGWTMRSRRAAVRIDHILYQSPWQCRGVRVGPDLGSAHRPVLADFQR